MPLSGHHDPFQGPKRGPEDQNYWCVNCNATNYFSPLGGNRWQCKSCGRPAEFVPGPAGEPTPPSDPDPSPELPYRRKMKPGMQQTLPGIGRGDLPPALEGVSRFDIEAMVRGLGKGKSADGLVEDLW